MRRIWLSISRGLGCVQKKHIQKQTHATTWGDTYCDSYGYQLAAVGWGARKKDTKQTEIARLGGYALRRIWLPISRRLGTLANKIKTIKNAQKKNRDARTKRANEWSRYKRIAGTTQYRNIVYQDQWTLYEFMVYYRSFWHGIVSYNFMIDR